MQKVPTRVDGMGFWKHLRDGVKQLHLVDVEIGRILLRCEGYTGSLEEPRRVAGKFDEKVRCVLPLVRNDTRSVFTSSTAHAAGMLKDTGQEADKAAG
jgi:hypothetical protein